MPVALDPLTAALNLANSITELVTIVIKSQTPEQQKIMWDWYIEDIQFLRSIMRKHGNL